MTGAIAFIVGGVLGLIAGAFVMYSWIKHKYLKGDRLFWIETEAGEWK